MKTRKLCTRSERRFRPGIGRMRSRRFRQLQLHTVPIERLMVEFSESLNSLQPTVIKVVRMVAAKVVKVDRDLH
jgi:hypothetical protein